MTEATPTWSIWQALLNSFAWCFTRRGFCRFAEWITTMALNVEEHTVTQSVLALKAKRDGTTIDNCQTPLRPAVPIRPVEPRLPPGGSRRGTAR